MSIERFFCEFCFPDALFLFSDYTPQWVGIVL